LSPENFPSEETEMSRSEKAAAIAAANKATARAIATFIAITAEKAAAAAAHKAAAAYAAAAAASASAAEKAAAAAAAAHKAAAAIAATTEEPAVDDWPPDPEDGSEYGPPLTTW
jgi:hypothetical protein